MLCSSIGIRQRFTDCLLIYVKRYPLPRNSDFSPGKKENRRVASQDGERPAPTPTALSGSWGA